MRRVCNHERAPRFCIYWLPADRNICIPYVGGMTLVFEYRYCFNWQHQHPLALASGIRKPLYSFDQLLGKHKSRCAFIERMAFAFPPCLPRSSLCSYSALREPSQGYLPGAIKGNPPVYQITIGEGTCRAVIRFFYLLIPPIAQCPSVSNGFSDMLVS
ncbi:hypothetical protein K461DRAFT_1099 [Myriangium duriaei CBS 260.36]|uniref:Uncharacterized protein n=1 Tax=Myriangium duriaei CBS 260.36 TaxID=1168546 RepID=A0A9P4MKR9_9PEZI|nr:hypothetical protein K461DRAFT_1099 [Myriangium duriaei CBS 260.36]